MLVSVGSIWESYTREFGMPRASVIAAVVMCFLAMLPFAFCIGAARHPAHAHMHGRPDLKTWFSGLHNGNGMPCCDGSDAVSLEDPDWDASAEGHYRVKLEGQWVDVPADAVVTVPNRYGPALVWPWYLNGKPAVRCFMPGAGA